MSTSAIFFFDGPQFEQAVDEVFGLSSVYCDAVALSAAICQTYGWTLDAIHYHMALTNKHFADGSARLWQRELERMRHLGAKVEATNQRRSTPPKGFEIALGYAVCDAFLSPNPATKRVIVVVSQRRDFQELAQEAKRHPSIQLVTAVPSSRHAQIRPIPAVDSIIIDEAMLRTAVRGPWPRLAA